MSLRTLIFVAAVLSLSPAAVLSLSPAAGPAQARPALPRESAPGNGLKRTRLYLKDGSYQVVLSYRVQGANVYYLSAERAAEQEAIPTRLVDLDATHAWEQRRDAGDRGVPAVVLDPELAREEADRASRSPEVAKDLHLPDEDSVLALDTYRGEPQLAVLLQTDGELNRQTAHNILRQSINPLAHAHQVVEIKGQSAPVQLHVGDPELYIRIDDDDAQDVTTGNALQVDTGGNRGGKKIEKATTKSEYVIVRVDVRRDVRVVTSFSINLLGGVKRQADVLETVKTIMPGGHWLKIVPKDQLSFGEYALVEVLNDREVNLGVWDFGIHPTAGPNRDAIEPVARRAPTLAPRRAQP